MKSETELLKAARELISDPARWTQGMYARDGYGKSTESYHDDAVCWCAYGAIRKVVVDAACVGMTIDLKNAIDVCATSLSGEECNGIWFNDSHTHAEVLQMFDCAIKRSETTSC